jgi:hypothetical protein
MIERISSAKAFHRTPSQRTKALGTVFLCRAEYLPKIFGEKLAEFFSRYCRNRPHLIASTIDHRDRCAHAGGTFCCRLK